MDERGYNCRLSIKFEKTKKNLILTFSTQHYFIAGIYIVTLYVFCKFWHIFLHTYHVLLNTHIVFYKKSPLNSGDLYVLKNIKR